MSEIFFRAAVAGAGDHLKNVVAMMINGVAFQMAGPGSTKEVFVPAPTYRVFSHEGDELGVLTVADVCYAINYMKRLGRPVGKCHSFTANHCRNYPAFSFAWVGWHDEAI